MGRLSRTRLERRNTRQDRRIRREPTSLRTIAILIYQNQSKGNEES